MKSQPHRAAEWYAAHLGWRVLPLHAATEGGECTCGRSECGSVAKHPRTLNGVNGATTGPTTIAKWWHRWPEGNVGIATGPESGLVVLDVDPRHGGDEALAELEAKHGKLPETVEALTGGGGRHIFFAHPAQHVGNSASQLGRGLDVRGSGGYVVAPPSVHASGRAYEWEGSSRPNEVAVAPMPPWLLERIASMPQATPGARAPGEGTTSWRKFFCEPWPEGERNMRAARAAGYLLRSGLDPVITLDIVNHTNQACGQPPLVHNELARVVKSIWTKEKQRRGTPQRKYQ